MPGTLGLLDLQEVAGAEWPAFTRRLLEAGRPLLAVARLVGEAIALGRYQQTESVLTEAAQRLPRSRRVTGGRAIVLGEGRIAVALVLPHRSWLSAEGIPASRFLNRTVRGVLSGLARLEVGAYYFGRDFVTVDSSQAGHLSFEIAASGAALMECVLAVESHWWLPEAWDALPARTPRKGVPGPGSIHRLDGLPSARILEAMAAGYQERFGVTCRIDEGPLPSATVVSEPAALPRSSGLCEVPIGFVEVQAAVENGHISAASFNGDFLADSPGVIEAERGVVGSAPALADLAPRLNAVYSLDRHTIMGLPDLGVWAEGLIEACRS